MAGIHGDNSIRFKITNNLNSAKTQYGTFLTKTKISDMKNNIKNALVLIILCLPSIAMAQGIKWTEGLSWDQVKQRAKTDNKYIFIDVYATWCGPCKQMDQEIYPLEAVGKLYNEKFIAIRIQADQTAKDDISIKNRYADAAMINTGFKVGAYPTFLFLSPDGKLVNRASGGFNAEMFIGLANNALQQKDYTSRVEAFAKGEYANLDLKELAMSVKYAGNDSLATAIATAYVETTDVKELIKQENMAFIFNFGENNKEWAQKICLPKIKDLSIDQLGQSFVHSVPFICRQK
jgi:thioredoxin-related protein